MINIRKRLQVLTILLSLFISSICFAADYYVGAAATGSEDCSDADNVCLVSTANAAVSAGETVYLRAGTYTVSSTIKICPANNGSSGNVITYVNYNSEEVIFEGSPPTTTDQKGADITSDYIKIDGIKFKDLFQAIYINSGNYNEIDSCEVYHTALSQHGENKQPGIFILGGSTNNWVHDSTIHYMGFSGCDEGHDGIKIGHSSDSASNNNTIEDNIIYNMGHSAMDIYAQYNVIRNNVVHNEGWKTDPTDCNVTPDTEGNDPGDGKFGHRNFSLTQDSGHSPQYTLFEGNRAGHSAANPVNAGAEGLALGSQNNIIRYNFFFGNDGNGIYEKSYGLSPTGNVIYNNTFYYNGRFTGSEVLAADISLYGLLYLLNADNQDIRNNIFNANVDGSVVCQGCEGDRSGEFANSTWASNACEATDSDIGCTQIIPAFLSTDMSDMTSTTEPTLEISNGDTIDNGTYLTQANGAGSSSTSLIVDNSLFFQAGSAASTTPMGADISNIAADYICVGATVAGSSCVQLTDINHGTKTLTLASAQTWSDDDYVWLQKDSDGTKVLLGSAPDQGAYEYGDVTAPTISNASPSGTIACSNTVELSIDTNENATCKYDTSDDTYANLSNTFGSTGGTSHSQEIELACDASYTYYTRCQDGDSNANSSSTSISFTISAESSVGGSGGSTISMTKTSAGSNMSSLTGTSAGSNMVTLGNQ